MGDIVEELIGEVANQEPTDEPEVVHYEDGSLLVDGRYDIEALAESLDLPDESGLIAEGYRTLGGFIATHLGRLPQIGDSLEFGGHRFEVIDMDRLRVERILISPAPEGEEEKQL